MRSPPSTLVEVSRLIDLRRSKYLVEVEAITKQSVITTCNYVPNDSNASVALLRIFAFPKDRIFGFLHKKRESSVLISIFVQKLTKKTRVQKSSKNRAKINKFNQKLARIVIFALDFCHRFLDKNQKKGIEGKKNNLQPSTKSTYMILKPSKTNIAFWPP